MNGKAKREKKQVVPNNSVLNVLSQEELGRRMAEVASSLKASTWRDLETHGKFGKNEKLSFISEDMLIVGCDIGSEEHFARAIDTRGRELSCKILSFSNDAAGFQKAYDWMLELAACSSGKHKGQTRISYRGRKRLRYWLFQAARSAVAHAKEFKSLHVYYTTRLQNPLKKMQSLIVIACKILRIVFTILQTGRPYSPTKMLQNIKRTEDTAAQAA